MPIQITTNKVSARLERGQKHSQGNCKGMERERKRRIHTHAVSVPNLGSFNAVCFFHALNWN